MFRELSGLKGAFSDDIILIISVNPFSRFKENRLL